MCVCVQGSLLCRVCLTYWRRLVSTSRELEGRHLKLFSETLNTFLFSLPPSLPPPPPPSSSSLAKSAVTAFAWSCVAVRYCDELPSYLLRCQATFLAATTHDRRRWSWDTAVRRLHQLWRQRPGLVAEYGSCLLTGEPYLSALCLLGVLVEYSQAQGEGLQQVSTCVCVFL